MPTLKWNRRNSYTIPISTGDLVLYPGYNLNVDQSTLTEIKKHPIVKSLIEEDVLVEVIGNKDPNTEVEGIPVVDTVDEPLPAMPVQDRSAAKSKKPTKEDKEDN